jgi:hypothetical protein
MTGKRFLNLRDVISQERAEEILRPYEDDLREPFFTGWHAWTDLASFNPAYHAKSTRRGRASLVFDHVMDDAKTRFDGRDAEGIRTSDDYDSYLVAIGDEIVVRFKMFDQNKRPRSYPTKRQIDIEAQQGELNGMPPRATVVSIGYRLNEAQTGLKDIYITCWQLESLKWSFPIWEAVASDQLFRDRAVPSASDQADMPKPIVRPKLDKRKAEGE